MQRNSFWSRIVKVIRIMSSLESTGTGAGLPVVVILGSTATGKSKLAIDLASKFGGEIISADSMQVYKGLDILTNKTTSEEMKGIQHHMLGIVNRREKFDVIHFRDQALPMVERILKAGKIPFIVGGTNYYIESILWEVLIGNSSTFGKRKCPDYTKIDDIPIAENPILELMKTKSGDVLEPEVAHWTNQELHAALQLVDSERASRLHPNDRRKVVRSLQVRFQTGRKHSELIAEQCLPLAGDFEIDNPHNSERILSTAPVSSTALGGPLRFPSCICLWIQADKEILHRRIDHRVDNMINLGLKQELDSYMDALQTESSDLNYEEGILQSIGFKEFSAYLQLMPNQRETEAGKRKFTEGVERLKVVTKQYAKKQEKWIKQRFLLPYRRQVPPVYALDGNLVDTLNWEENVTSMGERIVDAYLKNTLDIPLLQEKRVSVDELNIEEDLVARICETCDNRVFIGKRQWDAHLESGKHRRMVKRKGNSEKSVSKSDDLVFTPSTT